MSKHTSIIAFLLLALASLSAQPLPSCLSNESLFHFQQEHPNAVELIAQREATINNWIEDYQQQGRVRSDVTYTIPVVVHVVWYEEEDNIPDAQIIAQIDILNEDYNFKNRNNFLIPAEFEERVATVGFEFCLATSTPDGNPTNGITRTQTTYDNIGNFCDAQAQDQLGRKRIFRSNLGGKDAWDTERYLNIWVTPLGNGLIGRATPPEPFITNDPCSQLQPYEDGVIIDPKYFGPSCYPPHHLGRTATHEIGHYFNLIHIFGLDSDDCDTDFVDDTPEQKSAYAGCPRYPQRSCLSPASDMFMNFMDLVDDECMAMFSEGQKMRMLAALLGPRKGLIENNACQVPPLPNDVQLHAFPSPATDCIYVRFDSPVSDQEIDLRIYDAAGRLVYSDTHNARTIPPIIVRYWGSGIFIVEAIAGSEKLVKKVLVAN